MKIPGARVWTRSSPKWNEDTNRRLGNYEILEEIGRDGMGVIFRVRQRHSCLIVGVKRVLGYNADSRETLARFRGEA
jgi:eukaryotic-like serine/threonine-protein kinase